MMGKYTPYVRVLFPILFLKQFNIHIIHQANAGDSRAVLCAKGKVEELSTDHKPENAGE